MAAFADTTTEHEKEMRNALGRTCTGHEQEMLKAFAQPVGDFSYVTDKVFQKALEDLYWWTELRSNKAEAWALMGRVSHPGGPDAAVLEVIRVQAGIADKGVFTKALMWIHTIAVKGWESVSVDLQLGNY